MELSEVCPGKRRAAAISKYLIARVWCKVRFTLFKYTRTFFNRRLKASLLYQLDIFYH